MKGGIKVTDNQKRAHDLAILYMYAEIKNGSITVDNDETIHAISFVSEYENIYGSLSEAIESSDEIR